MLFTDAQFTCLVDKYIDTVFRVALNYLKVSADAEDITQSVFEKLLRQRKEFESDDHIRHWLIRVTINECKHLLRSPWRKVGNLDDYARTIPFETTEQSDLYLSAMELPKKYRLPIYLYYYEEYSAREIGAVMGVSESAVGQYLTRGRRKLRAIIADEERRLAL